MDGWSDPTGNSGLPCMISTQKTTHFGPKKKKDFCIDFYLEVYFSSLNSNKMVDSKMRANFFIKIPDFRNKLDSFLSFSPLFFSFFPVFSDNFHLPPLLSPSSHSVCVVTNSNLQQTQDPPKAFVWPQLHFSAIIFLFFLFSKSFSLSVFHLFLCCTWSPLDSPNRFFFHSPEVSVVLSFLLVSQLTINWLNQRGSLQLKCIYFF